ncbi:hypothetical protein FOL47_000960 [Perkinsus chesapeaki]|uniref:Mei2-like C-terminal RNA recognition motif domain-containing protein n=1 Tax=Perkinsus chesapeaki TaxID=330153 RepID=A0A7J6MKK9_PERCH|nr:hypothetical protein FOL47_000960 [Perkinsus chesapeaki]
MDCSNSPLDGVCLPGALTDDPGKIWAPSHCQDVDLVSDILNLISDSHTAGLASAFREIASRTYRIPNSVRGGFSPSSTNATYMDVCQQDSVGSAVTLGWAIFSAPNNIQGPHDLLQDPTMKSNRIGRSLRTSDTMAVPFANKDYDNRTTLMIKNIPYRYTRVELIAELERRLPPASFDFVYLPMDFRSTCNFGYAFVNMTSPLYVKSFFDSFHGAILSGAGYRKMACTVALARVQGLKANIERFLTSPIWNAQNVFNNLDAGLQELAVPALFLNGVQQPFPRPILTLASASSRRALQSLSLPPHKSSRLVASAPPTTAPGQYANHIGPMSVANSQQYHQQQQMTAVTAAAAATPGNSASNNGDFSPWGGAASAGRQYYAQAQGYPGFVASAGQQASSSSAGQAGQPAYAGAAAAAAAPYYPQYNQYYQSAAAAFARPHGVQQQNMPYAGGGGQQDAAGLYQQQQQYANQFGGHTVAATPPGKGGASQPQRWVQQSPARPISQNHQNQLQQQQSPAAAGPSHAPRYSTGSDQQPPPALPATAAAVGSALLPTPLKVVSPPVNQGAPNQATGRPSLGVARSGSRYDQRQRKGGKGGKGKAAQQQSSPTAASPATQCSSPPQPKATAAAASPPSTQQQQYTGPQGQMSPPLAMATGYGIQGQARPKAVSAVASTAPPPPPSQLPAGPTAAGQHRPAGPGSASVMQSAGSITISDTRGLSQSSPASGAKYSELMTSVLPPLRPGEAEFILEMWTDKRARFPMRSTILTSRWQTSPDHTYRHRMQIYPRGYQLKDLPAAQRKPTDSWLAVNVIVEHEPKPQSPFAGTTYPWMSAELKKQVMVWIPNYKSPSTSIIRYGPGVFSKQQPTLGWSGLLDLQSDPAKLIEAGWIDSSGKLVIRSMVVDSEKDVVVKVAFTSSWLKTKQEVADAQAKAKAQEQMELDKEAEAARQAARQLALAASGTGQQSVPAQAKASVGVPGKGQGGGTQISQGRKWIQPAFPNHEEVAEQQRNTQQNNAAVTEMADEQPRPTHGGANGEQAQEHRRQSGHRGRRGGRNRNGKQEVITVITHKPGEAKVIVGEKAKGDDETEEEGINKEEDSWGTPDSGTWEKKRKSTDPSQEEEDQGGQQPPPAKVRRGPSAYDSRPPMTKHHESSNKPLTPSHASPSAAVQICDSRKKAVERKAESWEVYCSKANDRSTTAAQKGKSSWSDEWEKDQEWDQNNHNWSKKDRSWDKVDQGWENVDRKWEKQEEEEDWERVEKKDEEWKGTTWERWDEWERSDWEESKPAAVGVGEKWADAWERETKEEAADASPSWRSSYAAEWTKSEVPKDFWEEKAEPEPLSVIRDARRPSLACERQPPPAAVAAAAPIRERMPNLPVHAKQRTRYTMKDDTTPLSSRSQPGPVWDWRQHSRSRDRSQNRLKPLVRTPPPQEPRKESPVDRPVLLRPRPEAAREPSIVDDRCAPRPLPTKPVRPSKPRAKSSQRRTTGEAPTGHMVYDRPAGHDMAYYRRQSDKW